MSLDIINVEKRYLNRASGTTINALNGVSIKVEVGQTLGIVGESGCGKSTLARAVVGLEVPSAGSITWDGAVIDNKAKDRLKSHHSKVQLVFQDPYSSLNPRQQIENSIAEAIEVHGLVARDKVADRVTELLVMVGLDPDLRNRYPHQLSGGQRQRIALARALVLRPKVLLLDEPLGALDKQLREEMQVELKRIQREAGITFIFVTHDQEEAMRMSDRIAVFNEGSIEQIGTPQEVYEKPQTKFVASFLGVSNIFEGAAAKEIFGSPTMVNIRPERIKLVPADTKLNTGESGVVGTIIEASYIGATTIYLIQTQSGQRVIATRLNEELPDQINRYETGDRVGAVWKSDHSAVIPT
jgi:putative spermidine/putrescine transport system ATP-binding protein